MICCIILPEHEICWNSCAKRAFTPIFVNQFSFTTLKYFICFIDLPHSITLYGGIIALFYLINSNSKDYAETSDDDIGIPTDYRAQLCKYSLLVLADRNSFA